MSKAELAAKKLMIAFNQHRMLLAFVSMAILTIGSIYFNFRLGQLNADYSDMTWYIMPLCYSFLDVALLVTAMCVFGGIIKGLLMKLFSVAWGSYLLALSLFACLSCIIALDAQKSSSGDEFRRGKLERALAQAEDNVATWQTNFERTEKHKSRFQDRLDHATAERDRLIHEISKMDSSTPPSQVIFEAAMPFLPVWIDDADQFRLMARLSFGFAMIITPLFMGALLSNVFKREDDYEEQAVYQGDHASLGKPETVHTYGQWAEPEPVKQQWSDPEPVQYDLPELVPSTPKSVQNGPNSTEKKSVPPNRTGQTSDKYRIKMRTAIINRSVPDLKYSTLTDKCGGSKSTAKSVLEDLAGQGIVQKEGRSWTWVTSKMEAQG